MYAPQLLQVDGSTRTTCCTTGCAQRVRQHSLRCSRNSSCRLCLGFKFVHSVAPVRCSIEVSNACVVESARIDCLVATLDKGYGTVHATCQDISSDLFHVTYYTSEPNDYMTTMLWQRHSNGVLIITFMRSRTFAIVVPGLSIYLTRVHKRQLKQQEVELELAQNELSLTSNLLSTKEAQLDEIERGWKCNWSDVVLGAELGRGGFGNVLQTVVQRWQQHALAHDAWQLPE